MPPEILTIGHSNHTMERFIALLRDAGVTALADVRSAPWSRFVPQFNHEALRTALRAAGIAYVHLGALLGGRPRDPSLYRDGMVEYDRIATSAPFQAGLRRVLDGAATHRVVLMCTEQQPLECHRCRLIGRALATQGVPVRHILPDGATVTQQDLEAELLRGADDLFLSAEERLAAAYRALL